MKQLLKIKLSGGILMALLMTSISPAEAICLNDCQSKGGMQSRPEITYQENRRRSHNFGDVKNSIVGNVNIRVGHDRIDIGGFQGSNQNYIDASIHSTVILGDMKQ
jgi:hypothetical protein